MSRRPSLVIDLGSLHMAVGGYGQAENIFSESHVQSDVERLEELMGSLSKKSQSVSTDSDDHHAPICFNPIQNKEINLLEVLSQELTAISEHVTGHLSLNLQGKSFDGMKLIVFELHGRIHFELHLKTKSDSEWLSSQLQNLANEVGRRLNRSLRIQLISTDNTNPLIERADWTREKDD
jgi:hypothetical protein